jgi:antitoxin ParD1/3/4
MGKNTSISLGDHFESYIASQVKTGHYGNRSEVIRDALRDHEERQQRVEALRQALIEGEESGACRPFDMEEIIASARKKAGLDG